jgi:hypothetical protein
MVDRDHCVWAEEIDVEDNCVLTVRYANGAKMTHVECPAIQDCAGSGSGSAWEAGSPAGLRVGRVGSGGRR